MEPPPCPFQRAPYVQDVRDDRAVLMWRMATPGADVEVLALAEPGSPELRWLEETLASAARDSPLAWTVVFTHRPLYSQAAGFSGHGPDRRLRRSLELLFLEHGAYLVLTGHDHHYQRSRPVRGGNPAPPGCGPVHFVTGGGRGLRGAARVVPRGRRSSGEPARGAGATGPRPSTRRG